MPAPKIFSHKVNGFRDPGSRACFIREMPKAELHVHIEGTMRRALIEELAVKNGITLPADFWGPKDNIAWTDLKSFVDAYDRASSVIRSKDDFQRVVYDYLKRSAEQGVIYSEITLSPQHMARIGVSYDDTIAGAVDAIAQVKKEGYAIDARLLVVLVRHQGRRNPAWAVDQNDAVEAADQLVDQIIAHRQEKKYGYEHVVGIGLAGAEAQFPIRLFAKSFKKAARAGLKITAHAGEFASHEEVHEAIAMGVSRVGHGIHAAFDSATLEEVANKKIHLELCPSSNGNLVPAKSYPAPYQELGHAITVLDDAGVRYSINTDDPPFFLDSKDRLVNICTEIEVACELLPTLDPQRLLQVQQHAIEDSFAPEILKAELLNQLNTFAVQKGQQALSEVAVSEEEQEIMRMSPPC